MLAMENFKLDAFIMVIEELLRADETERALWVCNNLPAYYRDNAPTEINNLRNEILKRICTPRDYIRFDNAPEFPADALLGMAETLRGRAIIKEVELLNESDKIPHVVDFGPGDYWVPYLLNHRSLRFTYQPLPLSHHMHKLAEPYFAHRMERNPGQPVIYCAFEIIEHLWHEAELKTEMLKACGLADIVHISTPRYTYDWTCPDWKLKSDLGHLRAYTPNDLANKMITLFPEYEFKLYPEQIMHVRLKLKPGLSPTCP